MNPLPAIRPAPPGRRGTSLLELVVTGILLSSILLTLLPGLARLLRTNQHDLKRQHALVELSNLQEAVQRLPADQLTSEAIQQLPPGKRLGQAFPEGRLSVAVAPEGDAGGRRVLLTYDWVREGQPASGKVQLAAWVYPPAGGVE